jgi:hypothetical protein
MKKIALTVTAFFVVGVAMAQQENARPLSERQRTATNQVPSTEIKREAVAQPTEDMIRAESSRRGVTPVSDQSKKETAPQAAPVRRSTVHKMEGIPDSEKTPEQLLQESKQPVSKPTEQPKQATPQPVVAPVPAEQRDDYRGPKSQSKK